WNVTGAHVSAGLFKGLDFRMESLKALAAGGIAFASAGDSAAKPARQGQVFPLYAEARKEWLDWNAPIRIPSQKAVDELEARREPTDDERIVAGRTPHRKEGIRDGKK